MLHGNGELLRRVKSARAPQEHGSNGVHYSMFSQPESAMNGKKNNKIEERELSFELFGKKSR